MSSRADSPSHDIEMDGIESIAIDRDWQSTGSKLLYWYKTRGETYDENLDSPRKYAPVMHDNYFDSRACIYLEDSRDIDAAVRVNLGSHDDMLPQGVSANGEEIRYEITRKNLEVELQDGETDMEKALEEIEKLAELLSEASQEHYVRNRDSLHRV